MDFKPVDDNTLIRYARSFGAEARANNQTHVNNDDRESLGAYHESGIWAGIPWSLKEKLLEAWNEGWQAEDKNYA
jgi:hypothetical protein